MASLSDFVAEVEKFKNAPYLWGAAGPFAFDCSGLVQYSLEQLGIKNVPRTSEAQWQWVQKIDKSQLQPGDLVFASFAGESPTSPGHVGIYIGNDNIYSARDPAQGIGVDSLSSWGTSIIGYGRIPGIDATGTTSGVTTTGLIPNILSFPGDIVGFFKDAKILIDALLWIVNPASWLRIGSFLIGIILLALAAYAMMSVGSDEPPFKMPQVVPVPV